MMNMKHTIRILLVFLMLTTSNSTAWAEIKVRIVGDGIASVVKYDDYPTGACEAMYIKLHVKPYTNSYTRLDLITATKEYEDEGVTKVTTYPFFSDGTYYSSDPADVTGDYGSERDIVLYYDGPTSEDVIITVTFVKGLLKLQNELKNATVTLYDGGTAISNFNTSEPGDEIDEIAPGNILVMHIVPADGYWTNEAILDVMEATPSLARARNKVVVDTNNELELLKADEGYNDGRGWYSYKVPATHSFVKGYKYCVLGGEVVPKFDLSNTSQDQVYGTWMVTVSRKPIEEDYWTADISFTEASRNVTFDTYNHVPVISDITIKKNGNAFVSLTTGFDKQMTVTGGKIIGLCPMTLTAVEKSYFINASSSTFFGIDIPFTTPDGTEYKGSENRPWLITTPAELSMLAKCVNIGNCGFEGQFVRLEPTDGKSIDMSNITDFLPIGICSNKMPEGDDPEPGDYIFPFTGTFDGNNKTISNLNYTDNKALGDNTDWSIGLFGNACQGAVIKNVTLSGCSFTGSKKSKRIGGIAGYLDEDESTISGCTVIDCTITTGAESDECIGGIVGEIGAYSDLQEGLLILMQGILNGNRVRGTSGKGTTISGSSTSRIGAIFGNQTDYNSKYDKLNDNKYDYNVTVTRGNTTASAYTKRGYWNSSASTPALDDITGGNSDPYYPKCVEGAMLEVYSATLTVEPSTTTSKVDYSQGTDYYKVDGTTYYYSPGQVITLTATNGTSTDDIRTFNDELTALTVNGSTDGVTLSTPSFTMPIANAAVVATFSKSESFTIPSNKKSWMTFYHNWEDAAPTNYTVSDGDGTNKSIEVLTISGISGSMLTTADLNGVSFSGVPTLFHYEDANNGVLPDKLKFTPTTATNTATTATAFVGGVADLSTPTDYTSKKVYVLFNGDFARADLSNSTVYDPHKCFIVTEQTAGSRLYIVHGEATEISNIDMDLHSSYQDSGWYDLQGRKLNGVPTKKGLYVAEGKLVVIK